MSPARLVAVVHLAVLEAAVRAARLRSDPGGGGARVSVPLEYFAGSDLNISSRAAEAKAIFRQGLRPAAGSAEEGTFHEGKNQSRAAQAHAASDHRWTHVEVRQGHLNQTEGPEPRVFFLFLTYEGLVHKELWQEFFSSVGATTDRWSALMHCKDRRRCEMQLALQNPLGLTLVGNVSNDYCVDLVSPMVHLLDAALASGGSPEDKFVFLSESTLPVKPFALIYKGLTRNQDSDICISPQKDWVKLEKHRDAPLPTLLIRHSQWVVLSAAHARLMVRRWPQVKSASAGNWTISVWPPAEPGAADTGWMPKGALQADQAVCTDEWAIFATLFGVISSRELRLTMPGVESPDLFLASDKFLTETQGSCRTFETWGDPLGADGAHVAWQLSAVLSCYPGCERSGHPAHFLAATDRALWVLRNSSFMFARKIPMNLVNPDQFSRIILGEPYPWSNPH